MGFLLWVQVLTKAALLAYERLHVTKGILDREWNGHTKQVAYVSKVVAAWYFDIITSGAATHMMLLLNSPVKARHPRTYAAREILQGARCLPLQGSQQQRAGNSVMALQMTGRRCPKQRMHQRGLRPLQCC